MRILIVTPINAGTRSGNRITSDRWARMLRESGWRVQISGEFQSQTCDVMIALHAHKSAASICRFHERFPDRPLIVALTGTDLYRDVHRFASARRSLDLADRLILLQPHGSNELERSLREKVCVIHQSAIAARRIPPPLKNKFEVSVIGHLRAVKDPFRTAMAVRDLPAESRISVTHYGCAMNNAMRRKAETETQHNARYRWLSNCPHWQVMQRLARSRLLVLSSRMEGGANVIGESIVAGTPVIASRISGSIGLLGEDYAGFFETGDTRQLRDLLIRAEHDTAFYRQLVSQCKSRKHLFAPQREQRLLERLINEVC